ncbi:uncharacterized protein [Parasteatoda tepidariorum]|uniref:uncharacterized protein n=1 Tax=Parasteatoda tepidariorum TaxID=114398 RepID=UPI00077F92CB|nr:uncharacterized protein LOC107449815 [Parasteatoda tepidariorum]XP_042904251.1 uncharacterized protein LOC107449815 [Parasteatoda tepidariorum]
MERKQMKWPVTFAAQIQQFPYKWFWNNFWLPRFVVGAMAVTFPFFLFIHKSVNTPENKAIWAEKHKKERQYHFH